MAKRRNQNKFTYDYECTLTGEKFTVTTKAKNPEELVSVKGFYQLHPELNDLPPEVNEGLLKDQEEKTSKTESKSGTIWEELVQLSIKHAAERELRGEQSSSRSKSNR